MRLRSSPAILTTLRQSSRLPVLLLLVFALKLMGFVACTAHDMLDLAQGAGASVDGVTLVAESSEPTGENPFDLNGACEHCGCHQAAAVLPVQPIMPSIVACSGPERVTSTSSNIPLARELRPPIV